MKPWITRRNTGMLLIILIALSLLSRCGDKDQYPLPTSLRIIHSIPGTGAFDVYLDNTLAGTLAFPNSVGYLPLAAGRRVLHVLPAGSPFPGGQEGINLHLAVNRRYSLILMNTPATPELRLLADTTVTAPADRAFVRFMHLAPDADTVTILAEGLPTALAANRVFSQFTPYVSIENRVYNFYAVTRADTVASLLNFPINPARTYMLTLVGLANAPAGSPDTLRLRTVEGR